MGAYADPLTEIASRLTFHTGAGELLAAYNFAALPVKEVEGPDDLPAIRMFIPTVNETYRTGNHGQATMTANLTVSIKREDGVPALMTATELVIDAIETNTSGEANPGLNGTLMKPFSVSVSNSYATTNSLVAEIALELTPKVFERANRRQL